MTPESLIIIFVALAIGSFSKGMTGLGLPPVSIAIMAVFVGVEHAIVVTTIPVAFANFTIVWVWRQRIRDVPQIWFPVVSAAAGVALGTWVLATLDEKFLTLVLTVWIAFYLLTVLLNLKTEPQGQLARIFSPLIAGGAGICQGATGMCGPFIATWGHAWGFVKETYVFATSLLFTSISAAHVVGVGIAGLYDQERVLQGLLAIIPVLMFTPLGMGMAGKVSARTFNLIIVGIIAAMEVRLVWGLVNV
ncbi:MAG: sulfite exporter TauE/SafE family protein [Pseudomonadota bacterium]|nr:sulfite exporter TauE/SafE family protein [Pseudomonadota bacterium]